MTEASGNHHPGVLATPRIKVPHEGDMMTDKAGHSPKTLEEAPGGTLVNDRR